MRVCLVESVNSTVAAFVIDSFGVFIVGTDFIVQFEGQNLAFAFLVCSADPRTITGSRQEAAEFQEKMVFVIIAATDHEGYS